MNIRISSYANENGFAGSFNEAANNLATALGGSYDASSGTVYYQVHNSANVITDKNGNVTQGDYFGGVTIFDSFNIGLDNQASGGTQTADLGLDVPLALWSIGSYAYGINENIRAISIAEKNVAMLKQLQNSVRLNVGRPSASDRSLIRQITKNNKMIEGMKLGARRMAVVGLVFGVADMANNDFSNESVGWFAADAIMTGIGLTGWGAPIAGVYFAGRFAYGLYDMATKGSK